MDHLVYFFTNWLMQVNAIKQFQIHAAEWRGLDDVTKVT